MLLFNWGSKGKKVCDGGIHFCTNCNHVNTMEIQVIEKNIGLFFVPVAKWDKKFYLMCNRCTARFPLLDNKVSEFIRLATDGPSNELAIKIYNEIDKVFIEGKFLSSTGKLDSFPEQVVDILKVKGYEVSDIEKVLPAYLKGLAHAFSKVS